MRKKKPKPIGKLEGRKLTAEQQKMVEDCERWIGQETWKYEAWLGRKFGYDHVQQEARLAVVESAVYYEPLGQFTNVPFGAYARMMVRWKLKRLMLRVRQRVNINLEMPQPITSSDSFDDYNPFEPVCHRGDGRERLLSDWCSDDYTLQRQCLTWKTRIVLYLHCVEGWTNVEIGELFGVSRSFIGQLIQEAGFKLKRYRKILERGLKNIPRTRECPGCQKQFPKDPWDQKKKFCTVRCKYIYNGILYRMKRKKVRARQHN